MKKLLGLGYAFALVFTIACGRTDAGITTSVKSKLAADDAVKAYQVNVDTHDHVVTLSGTVDSELARSRAVALAREADGVRDVVDNLEVNDTVATSGRDLSDEASGRIREGADAVAAGTRKGADAVANTTHDAGDAAQRGAEHAEAKTKEAAKETGDAVTDSAKKVGKAAKKGAEAVADGAKKVGSTIKDAVTDDDPDTNKDGK